MRMWISTASTTSCREVYLMKFKAWFRPAKHVCGSVQFGSGRFSWVACAVKITFGSLWFNMASVYIINF